MSNAEHMLFALLRASLHEKETETSYFEGVSEKDWGKCFQFSQSQGVMALAWDGILKLPPHLHPPLELKLKWGVKVEMLERKYQRYCQAVQELTSFFQKHQIAILQLKGVGLSHYYPIPSHREGGDIDIYTFSANRSKMTDEEANRLADDLMRQQGIEVEMHSYKHSNFYYKGIPVENHKYFLNVKHYPIAMQVNEWLKRELKEVSSTPSPAFNTLFLAFHASQHYGSGLALHHLCDWAMLLKRYGLVLPEELKDKRFLEAIAAFTHLCNRYLGTSVKVTGGEALADEILEEVLHPRYPHKMGVPVKGKWNILVYKTRRFLYMSKVSNRILYLPLWKRIWKSVIAHLQRPETIFQTAIK